MSTILCRFLAILFMVSTVVYAQPVIFNTPLSPRIANYDIRVDLDVEKHTLHGKQLI